MSDCSVCLGSDDFDGLCEFYEAGIVKARKQHECVECELPIPPGAKYERVRGKYDGEFFTEKTCLLCCELRTAFTCDGGAIVHGMLWEEIRDYLFPNMTTGCLEKIRTAEAKAFLVKRWNDWKFRKPR